MTSFLHLNLQEYSFEQNVIKNTNECICCTSQNGVLINIETCKHTAFLYNNFTIKLDFKNMYVCHICHSMLKKIEIFKQQVEESIALLLDQAPVLKINKLHNLQLSALESDGSVKLDSSDVDLKSEVVETNTDLEMEVKIEHDFSDNEFDVPLATIERESSSSSNKVDKYEGKIKVIFLSKEELEEERRKMAEKESYLKLPFKCLDCIIGFDHEKNLKDHMEKRHRKKDNSFQCDVCKSVLSNKHSYYEHVKRHTRRLECMVCSRKYCHLPSAIQHYDEKHAPAGAGIGQVYSCKKCGFTSASNRVYRYHVDKHNQKRECNICGNTFVNNNGLKVHMYTVHKQSSRVYKCDKCDKSYRAKSGLTAHARSVHGADVSRAFCVVCQTHYRTERGLLHHMKTHSKHISENDKRFICNECGAKFVKKNDLIVHINWEHLKISTHRCTKCDKVFKSGSALKRHINYVHNKKRQPRNKICDYCGRAFTTQSILVSHIRTHTGERPLQCSYCAATFAHSAALYTHKKLLHTHK